MVRRNIQDVWRHNGGAAVVEYALLLAVIGAGLAFALSSLGAANNDVLTLSKAALGIGTFGADSPIDGLSGTSGDGSGSSASKGGDSGSSGQSGAGSSEQGADTDPTKQPKKPKAPPTKGKKKKLGRGQPR